MSGLLSFQCLFGVGMRIWPVFGFHCEQIKAHSTPSPLTSIRGCIFMWSLVWQFDRQFYLEAVLGDISVAV